MKPKILGMGNESYPGGRIDFFKIDENYGYWETIVDCLVAFEFKD